MQLLVLAQMQGRGRVFLTGHVLAMQLASVTCDTGM
jgi:hypothetical protein